MKNSLGNSLTVTLFGESHGQAIGAVIDGLAPGIEINEGFISHQLALRRPVDGLSTPRQEKDPFVIESGVFNGKTTGTPLCILIPNEDTRSKDYGEMAVTARPGHADYTGYVKYNGFNDYRGGGHFSGRITAALVAAGAIAISALKNKNIHIASHIAKCAGIEDKDFSDLEKEMQMLNEKAFAVLDEEKGEEMKKAILKAKEEKDSVGGVIETVVTGMPAGVGEPWFDTLESLLAHGLFSIPAVKGVEFGGGFALSGMRGSSANDEMRMKDGKVTSKTNNNGGINGGISNSMPIVFRCAVKPTPTIGKAQETVNFVKGEDTVLQAAGRHDPCIVHRARVVADSVTALVLCDALSQKYGTDWLAK